MSSDLNKFKFDDTHIDINHIYYKHRWIQAAAELIDNYSLLKSI